MSDQHNVIVAVDIETTGLDVGRDAIIEIGAVRFAGEQVLDEWTSLVNPGRKLTPFITSLTGIQQKEVDSAPQLQAVLPTLEQFVGDAPVLGHRVMFDLGFLRRAGVLRRSEPIDTYELAAVMLPTAPRYNLGALASLLQITLPATHRALDDARVTQALYAALWERAMQMPLATLAEISRNGARLDWRGAYFFKAAMTARSGEEAGAPIAAQGDIVDELSALWQLNDLPASNLKHLRPKPSPDAIDVEAVAALLEQGGRMAEAMSNYEHREQQISMLRAVGEALNESQHLLVEAGTGVGKSIGYLLPAIHYATKNERRVVVSTNTINLQEQIINKDLPTLQKSLGINFRSALLKGRGNYLCPRRYATMRGRGPTSGAEMRMLGKLLVWLSEGGNGDGGQLSMRGNAEQGMWRRLSAEDEGCTSERCSIQMEGICPLYRARRAAEASHILVVNHALLLADVSTENRVLPEYNHLIVDEAHHLEDATTGGLSFRTDPRSIQRLLLDLGSQRSGLLGEILTKCRAAIPPEFMETLEDYVTRIYDAASMADTHVETWFKVLHAFLKEHVRMPKSDYSVQIRLQEPMRQQPDWAKVEQAADNLAKFTFAIADAMRRMAGGLGDLEDFDIADYDDLVASATSSARHLEELHEKLHEVIYEPNPNTIYWVEIRADSEFISLHAALLKVGPLVEEYLWHAKDSVIMTSATLQTGDSFDFIRGRLNADEAEGLALGSPFDYETNTLLYLINDIPEPAERQAYQRAIERGLLELCRATEGRTLVLFTSHAQLRETSNAISDALLRDGIEVYDQSAGSNRSQLLESFRNTDKAVLLGTRSYWEGVDVPGDALSILCIVRLPFTVPSDPIFAARSELFESPFMDYAVPEATLRFRQGFGRLIRRKDDRGVVVIFDRRVLSKRYGKLFLDSLPQCTVKQGSLADLPQAASDWLEVQ